MLHLQHVTQGILQSGCWDDVGTFSSDIPISRADKMFKANLVLTAILTAR